jgi:hypothetical protein
MHERIRPSNPNAWPLWTTKSLKDGFSPFDVQRSATLQLSDARVTANNHLVSTQGLLRQLQRERRR